MEHNQNAFASEAATDEPASSSPAFATPAEEAAWWAGVQAGMAQAHIAASDEPPDPLAFEPATLRYRSNGLTPARQREYVEALADTGVGRAAAARIGVSERSIARLRRRAEGASFDLACAAARRIGAPRLHAIAWERAIEGTIKPYHYHGELKSEERVYDNRLLIYLLGKTEHLLDEPAGAVAVAGNWQPFVEALEQGLPPPDLDLRPAWQRDRDERLAGDAVAADDDDDDDFDEEIWEEEGGWMTSFPPPADFDGDGDGVPGTEGYRRTLSEAEEAALEADDAEEERERAEAVRRACARRDRYFGFEGGLDRWALPEGSAEEDDEDDETAGEAHILPPLEAGLSGPSAPSAEDPTPPRDRFCTGSAFDSRAGPVYRRDHE